MPKSKNPDKKSLLLSAFREFLANANEKVVMKLTQDDFCLNLYKNSPNKSYRNKKGEVLTVLKEVSKPITKEQIENLLKDNDNNVTRYYKKDDDILEFKSKYYLLSNNLYPYKDSDIERVIKYISDYLNEPLKSEIVRLVDTGDNSKDLVKEDRQSNKIKEPVKLNKMDEHYLPKFIFFDSKYDIRYVTSLFAKPFVILTGNSGTGKTQIAMKLASLFSAQLYSHSIDSDYYSVGDVINEWTVKKISNDTIYLTSETEPKRLRPIQKALLQEFIDFYKAHPDLLEKHGDEERALIRDAEGAKFDKYLYGFFATLRIMAKQIVESGKYSEEVKKEDNILLVPVGADWTDNTKILGYYNPLADNGAGKYEKTDVFKFIERAAENPDIPFFLILDEMNLSHVERYFSDFLSKMELLDYSENSNKVYFDISGYGKLELPKNLFITGTVNIDETTYMFSPKVLDRANVIEFKPDMNDVLINLDTASEKGDEKVAEAGVAEDFMQLANEIRSGQIPAEVQPVLEEIKPILQSFYTELEKCGFEFAYRTVKEIRLYAIASYKTAEGEKPSATDIADIQILQKVLPKIHGNRKQIGELLDELEKLCADYTLEESGKKIRQMKDHLNRFQYASFI